MRHSLTSTYLLNITTFCYSRQSLHPAPFTQHPYFNSIRARRGSNTCLAAPIPLLPLHRPGILAYHGMGWLEHQETISHYIILMHPYRAGRSIYLSGYTCTTIPHGAFGTRKKRTVYTDSSHGHHQQSTRKPPSIPLSSTRPDRYLSHLQHGRFSPASFPAPSFPACVGGSFIFPAKFPY